jgi:hypothetical protein
VSAEAEIDLRNLQALQACHLADLFFSEKSHFANLMLSASLMIPVKIECGCGQHYAFDVEPVNGHMPTAVKCPACGVDGTAAANIFIAEGMAAQPVAAPAAPPRPRVHVNAPASSLQLATSAGHEPAMAATGTATRGREIDRKRVETEARAKIFWGDKPEEVTKFVMGQGLDYEEASALVAAMHRERLANLRGIGVKKILIGAGMLSAPIFALVMFLKTGVLRIRRFAITATIGLFGLWMLIKGIMLLVAPQSTSEDVGETDDD